MATTLLPNIYMNNNITMVNCDDNVDGNDTDNEDYEKVNAAERDGFTEKEREREID